MQMTYGYLRPHLVITMEQSNKEISSTKAEIEKVKYGFIPRSLLFKLMP